MTEADFVGAKVALFAEGGSILTYLRDTRPGLAFAGHWDLPGGAREGGETPEDCACPPKGWNGGGFARPCFGRSARPGALAGASPGRKSRGKPVRHDKRRNRIEIMFGRLEDWRKVATCQG